MAAHDHHTDESYGGAHRGRLDRRYRMADGADFGHELLVRLRSDRDGVLRVEHRLLGTQPRVVVSPEWPYPLPATSPESPFDVARHPRVAPPGPSPRAA